MYDEYVSFLTFFLFFLSPSAGAADFLAAVDFFASTARDERNT